MGWDIDVYITVRRNQDIIPYRDISNNSSVDAYPNFVSNRRGTLMCASVSLANDYTLVDVAVSAYARAGINGNIIWMSKI